MWRVIATFIIVAFILYLSYLASKYIGKGMSRGGNSRYMRVIDQLMLGQDRHIAVIQVGGKYLLVGVTAGQISILSEVKDEELFPLAPEGEGGGAEVPSFGKMLGKLNDLGKRGGKD